MLAPLTSALMDARLRLRLSSPTILGATGWRNVAPLVARSVAFAIGMVAAVEAEALADRAHGALTRPRGRVGSVAVGSTVPVRVPTDAAMAFARR